MSVITISAPIGSGKALVNNTDVLTPNGVVKLKDIKEGDFVFGRDGKKTKVLGVFPQGKKRVYKVTLKDGSDALVNSEHLWTVGIISHPVNKDGKRLKIIVEKTMTTGEILNDKRFSYTHNGMTDYKYKLPVLKNALTFTKKKHLPVNPYVLGVFIGDGSTTSEYLTLSSNDLFVVKKVASLIGAEYKKNSVHNFNWSFKKDGKYIKTKDFFKDVPELIGLASEKYIPGNYLYSSKEQRISLLQGLMDTDGSINLSTNKNHAKTYGISYSTISDSLEQTFTFLVNSLGFRTRTSRDYREKYIHNDHVNQVNINIQNNRKQELFSLPAKRDIAVEAGLKGKKKHDYDYMSIISIEDLGYDEEMTCLYVESEDHLFLVNNFMLTHNTTLAKELGNLLETPVFYEPVTIEENPILPLYYSDQKKYGFLLQIFFLNKRFDAIKEAYKTNNAIIDSSIYTDSIFLDRIYKDGNVTKEEHDVYHSLIDNMMEEIDGLPYKKTPDLMIGINISPETELYRIGKRGRDFEQNGELIQYYKNLLNDYNEWYSGYDLSPKLTIDGDKYDFVNNKKDRLDVLTLILNKLVSVGTLKGKDLKNIKNKLKEIDIEDN